MPQVHAFRPLQYVSSSGDVSPFIAPPYDVLDAEGKARLLARDARNIVAADLPHVPAKKLGPPEAYAAAATLIERWVAEGVLTRSERPAIFAYRQLFEWNGRTTDRCGMICTLDAVPFGKRPGGGVLPHEQTFSGPKEDRLALMKATRAQLSPIFGLHADEAGRASGLVRSVMASRGADMRARSDDGVTHEVWRIEDDATIERYREALAGEDVFIADGHHRYNTALNYLSLLESQGAVSSDHPARRCMFVMVGMSDPGLVIGATHRVLGGMRDYTFDAFISAASDHLRFEPIAGDLAALERAVHTLTGMGQNRFGLYDMTTGRCAVAIPATTDPLAKRFSEKPRAWRALDVAIIQHLIVEEICQPRLNAGEPVTWAFPHTIPEVEQIASGKETGAGGGAGFAQLAVIVRPTPLDAVREICLAGELMPQKSTFFLPKLATGLAINPLA
ncbi:MAG: DUF1015 domain-containing protein [Phycisphaeraceae bacterium]|nr:DUF1015 domain-containing protein [Phycisphaeraceae bacterium]